MSTVILLRHGQSTANGAGVLAGRAADVDLDDTGRRQAAELVNRLAQVPLCHLVVSPMARCAQTVAGLAAAQGLANLIEPQVSEVDYGDWSGRRLAELANEPLWKVVQAHPSAVVFPGGEGLAQMQARAVTAVRRHNAWVRSTYGEYAVWLLCTHADVIKAILADALGLHLDGFQRIVIDPGSLSVIRYTETRPFVLRVNDRGDNLADVTSPTLVRHDSGSPRANDPSDAIPGGTTGH